MGFRFNPPTPQTEDVNQNGEGGDQAPDGQGEGGQGGEDKFSDRFAALSRKERELRGMEEKIKGWTTEKSDYQKQMDELKKWRTEQEEIEKIKDIDPLEYLSKKGLDYEKLTEHVVNRDDYAKDSEYRSLKKEMMGMKEYIESLKSELSGFKDNYSKEKESYQKQENEKATNQYLGEIKGFIEENAENYELVKSYGDPQQILESQLEYYQKHGKAAPLEEIIQNYEKYLEEQMEEQYNKMKGLKKFSSKYGQKDIFERDEDDQSDSIQYIPSHRNFHSKTLTNDFNGGLPPKSPDRRLSSEESLKEAAKMIRFLKH